MGRDSKGWTQDDDADVNPFSKTTDTANYQAVKLATEQGKFFGDVAYQHLTSTYRVVDGIALYDNGNTEADTDYAWKANIWSALANYRFDRNSALKAEYAKNVSADAYDTAYSFEYDYKGAEAANKGTWGAYVAYRKLGQYAAPWSTYGDGVDGGQKGVELGVSWIPFKNILAVAKYFDGKDIVSDRDASKLFGRFDFFF